MSLTIPPDAEGLVNALLVLTAGDLFPKADEDALRALADQARLFSNALGNELGGLDSLVASVVNGLDTSAGRAFARYGYKLDQFGAGVTGDANRVGELLDDFALSVENAKYQMIIGSTITAAMIAWGFATPWGAALVGPYTSSLRAFMLKVWGRYTNTLQNMLKGAITESAEEVSTSFLSQLIQDLQGNRSSYDLEDLGIAAGFGAGAGFVAPLISGLLHAAPSVKNKDWGEAWEKVANTHKPVESPSVGAQLTYETLTEAITEVVISSATLPLGGAPMGIGLSLVSGIFSGFTETAADIAGENLFEKHHKPTPPPPGGGNGPGIGTGPDGSDDGTSIGSDDETVVGTDDGPDKGGPNNLGVDSRPGDPPPLVTGAPQSLPGADNPPPGTGGGNGSDDSDVSGYDFESAGNSTDNETSAAIQTPAGTPVTETTQDDPDVAVPPGGAIDDAVDDSWSLAESVSTNDGDISDFDAAEIVSLDTGSDYGSIDGDNLSFTGGAPPAAAGTPAPITNSPVTNSPGADTTSKVSETPGTSSTDQSVLGRDTDSAHTNSADYHSALASDVPESSTYQTPPPAAGSPTQSATDTASSTPSRSSDSSTGQRDARGQTSSDLRGTDSARTNSVDDRTLVSDIPGPPNPSLAADGTGPQLGDASTSGTGNYDVVVTGETEDDFARSDRSDAVRGLDPDMRQEPAADVDRARRIRAWAEDVELRTRQFRPPRPRAEPARPDSPDTGSEADSAPDSVMSVDSTDSSLELTPSASTVDTVLSVDSSSDDIVITDTNPDPSSNSSTGHTDPTQYPSTSDTTDTADTYVTARTSPETETDTVTTDTYVTGRFLPETDTDDDVTPSPADRVRSWLAAVERANRPEQNPDDDTDYFSAESDPDTTDHSDPAPSTSSDTDQEGSHTTSDDSSETLVDELPADVVNPDDDDDSAYTSELDDAQWNDFIRLLANRNRDVVIGEPAPAPPEVEATSSGTPQTDDNQQDNAPAAADGDQDDESAWTTESSAAQGDDFIRFLPNRNRPVVIRDGTDSDDDTDSDDWTDTENTGETDDNQQDDPAAQEAAMYAAMAALEQDLADARRDAESISDSSSYAGTPDESERPRTDEGHDQMTDAGDADSESISSSILEPGSDSILLDNDNESVDVQPTGQGAGAPDPGDNSSDSSTSDSDDSDDGNDGDRDTDSETDTETETDSSGNDTAYTNSPPPSVMSVDTDSEIEVVDPIPAIPSNVPSPTSTVMTVDTSSESDLTPTDPNPDEDAPVDPSSVNATPGDSSHYPTTTSDETHTPRTQSSMDSALLHLSNSPESQDEEQRNEFRTLHPAPDDDDLDTPESQRDIIVPPDDPTTRDRPPASEEHNEFGALRGAPPSDDADTGTPLSQLVDSDSVNVSSEQEAPVLVRPSNPTPPPEHSYSGSAPIIILTPPDSVTTGISYPTEMVQEGDDGLLRPEQIRRDNWLQPTRPVLKPIELRPDGDLTPPTDDETKRRRDARPHLHAPPPVDPPPVEPEVEPPPSESIVSVGVPKGRLPATDTLVRDLRRAFPQLRQKEHSFWGNFKRELLSKFPKIAYDQRRRDGAASPPMAHPFRIGDLTLFISLELDFEERLPNPAGANDGIPGAPPRDRRGRVKGVDTVNGQYDLGPTVRTMSGSTTYTQFNFGTDLTFPQPTWRPGFSANIEVDLNRSQRSISHLRDGEYGKVEDSRTDVAYLVYRPVWVVRSLGDDNRFTNIPITIPARTGPVRGIGPRLVLGVAEPYLHDIPPARLEEVPDPMEVMRAQLLEHRPRPAITAPRVPTAAAAELHATASGSGSGAPRNRQSAVDPPPLVNQHVYPPPPVNQQAAVLPPPPGNRDVARRPGDPAPLPDHYYASGLSGLDQLYQHAIDIIATDNLTNIDTNSIITKLWNLDTNLHLATQGGYRFPVLNKRAQIVAMLQIDTYLAPGGPNGGPLRFVHDDGTGLAVNLNVPAMERVGSVSDRAHIEDIATAIDGLLGGHNLAQSTAGNLGMSASVATPGSSKVSFSTSFGAQLKAANSNGISASRVALWVHVARFIGRTGAYSVPMVHRISLLNPATDGQPGRRVLGQGMVRVPEEEAHRRHWPLEPESPYRIRDPRPDRGAPGSQKTFGRGVGMGLVRINDDTVRRIHTFLSNELTNTGFLHRGNAGLDAPHFSDGLRSHKQLDNALTLDKLVSQAGLRSNYDMAHQDGYTFTFEVPDVNYLPGVPGRMNSAKVTIVAVPSRDNANQRNYRAPTFVRTTNDFHTVNLAMGMTTVGQSVGGSAAIKVAAKGNIFKDLLRNFGILGGGYTYTRGANNEAKLLSNRPELLEYAHEVEEWIAYSNWVVHVEYQKAPALTSALPDSVPIDESYRLYDQPATVHTLDFVNGRDRDIAPLNRDSDVRNLPAQFLDNAVVYKLDTSGMRTELLDMMQPFSGPAGYADQELSTLVGTTTMRAFLKEAIRDKVFTELPFIPGWRKDLHGSASISANILGLEFDGATRDSFTLGIIKLGLISASMGTNENHSWFSDMLDFKVGAEIGPGDVSGVANFEHRQNFGSSENLSREAAFERIQLKFGPAYKFRARLRFTMETSTEHGGKFIKANLVTGAARRAENRADQLPYLVPRNAQAAQVPIVGPPPPQGDNEPGREEQHFDIVKYAEFLVPERDALLGFIENALPLTSQQLVDVMTRFTNTAEGDAPPISGTLAAKVLLAWHRLEPHARINQFARDVLAQHQAGDPRYLVQAGPLNDLADTLVPDARPRARDLPFQLPSYLTRMPENRVLGHSGVTSVNYNLYDGYFDFVRPTSLYDTVVEVVSRFDPRALGYEVVAGDNQPLTSKLKPIQGASEGLDGVLGRGREDMFVDDFMGDNGYTFYLVSPQDWFTASIIEINVKMQLKNDYEFGDVSPTSGNENYTHGYTGQSRTGSKGNSFSLTGKLIAARAENNFAEDGTVTRNAHIGRGSGRASASTGYTRSLSTGETVVSEQTVYDWGGHVDVSVSHETLVTARKINMNERWLNNMFGTFDRNQPWHSLKQMAGVERNAGWEEHYQRLFGKLNLELPLSIAGGNRPNDVPAPTDNSLFVGQLPGDATVTGNALDGLSSAADRMLTRIQQRFWTLSNLRHAITRTDRFRSNASATIQALLSRTQLNGHIPAAIGGEVHRLAENLMIPGHPDYMITIDLIGELIRHDPDDGLRNPEVVLETTGSGSGRYNKFASSINHTVKVDNWRGTLGADAGYTYNNTGDNTPQPAPSTLPRPDLVNGSGFDSGRTASGGTSGAENRNLRWEGHIKQVAVDRDENGDENGDEIEEIRRPDDEDNDNEKMYIVKFTAKFRLAANVRNRNLPAFLGEWSETFRSNWVEGPVYVTLSKSQYIDMMNTNYPVPDLFQRELDANSADTFTPAYRDLDDRFTPDVFVPFDLRYPGGIPPLVDPEVDSPANTMRLLSPPRPGEEIPVHLPPGSPSIASYHPSVVPPGQPGLPPLVVPNEDYYARPSPFYDPGQPQMYMPGPYLPGPYLPGPYMPGPPMQNVPVGMPPPMVPHFGSPGAPGGPQRGWFSVPPLDVPSQATYLGQSYGAPYNQAVSQLSQQYISQYLSQRDPGPSRPSPAPRRPEPELRAPESRAPSSRAPSSRAPERRASQWRPPRPRTPRFPPRRDPGQMDRLRTLIQTDRRLRQNADELTAALPRYEAIGITDHFAALPDQNLADAALMRLINGTLGFDHLDTVRDTFEYFDRRRMEQVFAEDSEWTPKSFVNHFKGLETQIHEQLRAEQGESSSAPPRRQGPPPTPPRQQGPSPTPPRPSPSSSRRREPDFLLPTIAERPEEHAEPENVARVERTRPVRKPWDPLAWSPGLEPQRPRSIGPGPWTTEYWDSIEPLAGDSPLRNPDMPPIVLIQPPTPEEEEQIPVPPHPAGSARTPRPSGLFRDSEEIMVEVPLNDSPVQAPIEAQRTRVLERVRNIRRSYDEGRASARFTQLVLAGVAGTLDAQPNRNLADRVMAELILHDDDFTQAFTDIGNDQLARIFADGSRWSARDFIKMLERIRSMPWPRYKHRDILEFIENQIHDRR